MLCLSRKINERIIIGDDIVITVVAIRGDKVRLGIDAPDAVPVHREETYCKILNEALDAGRNRIGPRPVPPPDRPEPDPRD